MDSDSAEPGEKLAGGGISLNSGSVPADAVHLVPSNFTGAQSWPCLVSVPPQSKGTGSAEERGVYPT